MSKKRRQHSAELKARVALEALKGIEPVHAIAAKYQVHPVQAGWRCRSITLVRHRLPRSSFCAPCRHRLNASVERNSNKQNLTLFPASSSDWWKEKTGMCQRVDRGNLSRVKGLSPLPRLR
jgi:transposase-like protein